MFSDTQEGRRRQHDERCHIGPPEPAPERPNFKALTIQERNAKPDQTRQHVPKRRRRIEPHVYVLAEVRPGSVGSRKEHPRAERNSYRYRHQIQSRDT
jgi:hypothetical protein